MKINMVIVTDNPSRGSQAGRHMADAMRQQMNGLPWDMHVHVRGPEDARVGKDTNYAEYNGGRR